MRWSNESDGVGAIGLGFSNVFRKAREEYVAKEKAELAAKEALRVSTVSTASPRLDTSIWSSPSLKTVSNALVAVPKETLEALETATPREKAAIETAIVKGTSVPLPKVTPTVWKGEPAAPAYRTPSPLPSISIPGFKKEVPVTYVIAAGVLLLLILRKK
jgi:hypothetical protein